MDVYTLEGSKVLFRVGVALFVLYKREAALNLVTISNSQEWWQTMKHWANHKLFNFDVVLRKAYGVHGQLMRTQFRFPSRTVLQHIIKAEEWRLRMEGSGEIEGEDRSFHGPPLGLAKHDEVIEVSGNVKESIEPILAKPTSIRQSLASWVPTSMRSTSLQLLYSTNYHGRSLDMFYSRLQIVKRSIILLEVLENDSSSMKDQNDENEKHETCIIGMYASQPWHVSNQSYGDGECFLFRATPNPKCWKWHPDPATEFDLTKEADFANNAILHQFILGQPGFISMGGNSDGSSGLRLNEDFTIGESSPASGYDNEPLHGVGKSSVFSIGLLEVYGLVRQMDGGKAF